MRLPHVHWFRWKIRREIKGCRCGLARRRMMGGHGYAYIGGRWWATPLSRDEARALGDDV